MDYKTPLRQRLAQRMHEIHQSEDLPLTVLGRRVGVTSHYVGQILRAQKLASGAITLEKLCKLSDFLEQAFRAEYEPIVFKNKSGDILAREYGCPVRKYVCDTLKSSGASDYFLTDRTLVARIEEESLKNNLFPLYIQDSSIAYDDKVLTHFRLACEALTRVYLGDAHLKPQTLDEIARYSEVIRSTVNLIT